MGHGGVFQQVQWGWCLRGSLHLRCHPTPRTRVPSAKATPPAHVLPNHGSKFLLMLIEIKLVVLFIGSKGCICSLGGEAHLVNFHHARACAVTLSSFVSSPDGFYSAVIPPGPRCHNFIGFMVAAGLPGVIV